MNTPAQQITTPDAPIGRAARRRLRGVSTREQLLAEVLGSVRLEDAEPSAELRAALDQWAAGELSLDDLGEIAKRTPASDPLKPLAPPRAA
jgi:hypothetical protein